MEPARLHRNHYDAHGLADGNPATPRSSAFSTHALVLSAIRGVSGSMRLKGSGLIGIRIRD